LSVKKIGRGPRENFKTKDIASIKSIIAYYLSDDKYLNKKKKAETINNKVFQLCSGDGS
jgi:hypothetical protein